jgi:hypothetical protein
MPSAGHLGGWYSAVLSARLSTRKSVRRHCGRRGIPRSRRSGSAGRMAPGGGARHGARSACEAILGRPYQIRSGGGGQTMRCTFVRRSLQASHRFGRCCRSKCSIADSSTGRVRRGVTVVVAVRRVLRAGRGRFTRRTLSGRSAQNPVRHRPGKSSVPSRPRTYPGRACGPCAPQGDRIAQIRLGGCWSARKPFCECGLRGSLWAL